MAKARKILHLDLDAFFCAVEEQLNPELRGQAIAVGGQPDQRGVVSSASYPARQYGVRSAMPMSQAVRLCPGLIVTPPNHRVYAQRSRQVMAILRDTAPDVEPLSIDEAFLDATILPGAIDQIARDLQRRIKDETSLPCSLGGASNKLVAKTANTIGKARQSQGAPPNAITIVPAGHERQFMAPLPIRALWGVGPRTAKTLAALGFSTIGEIAAWSEAALSARLGKLGGEIWQRAQGIDQRPVRSQSQPKSISKEITFAADIDDEAQLKRTLRRLSDGVGWQARKSGLSASTVKLKLRWSDFSTITRQLTLEAPTDLDEEICAQALALFERHWIRGQSLRLIGVGLSGLGKSTRQRALWDEGGDSGQSQELQAALDGLRDRFGDSTIRRASDLGWRKNDDNRR